jgi:hypothetical protein
MVAPLELPITRSPLFDEMTRIPKELNAHSKVYELTTIGDARLALARLRELRRDFDANSKRGKTVASSRKYGARACPLPGSGEDMLAGLSNIQRMRTIRSEIAYLEDLMVRIAAREFEIEEKLHRTYLTGIGQWSERAATLHRA